MEEDIDAVGSLCTGLCGGSWNSGGCRELVCRSGDLVSEIQATIDSCQPLVRRRKELVVSLLDCGIRVQDHGAICRLGDALRDGSRLLLRRLLGLGVAATVPVASFPSTVLWHRLNLTEYGQEGHESETNGQHSAEDTSPQVNKKRD